MERFGPGAYDKLVQDEVVEQYVILDFCMKLMKPLVQVDRFICHVVFSNGFKTATLYTFGNEPEIKKVLLLEDHIFYCASKLGVNFV